MSDNGLREDKELLLEVLDVFGIEESDLQSMDDTNFTVNNSV